QIDELIEAGCHLVRVAVPDMEAAAAVAEIKKKCRIPLAADIHFDYRLALVCLAGGVDKIRLNPGNIGSEENVKKVVRECKLRGVSIRIGINGGSLEKEIYSKYGLTAEAMVESAMGHIRILEENDFGDIIISLKSSSVMVTVDAYRLIAERVRYPLHVGITEAGTVFGGTVKSSAGIGAVLSYGIGDTIRVSLTGDPVEEVRVGKSILRAMELDVTGYEFISCPTCGRCGVDLIGIANLIENGLEVLAKQGRLKHYIKVAVMGCGVNGPGEASMADIGIAGGSGEVLLFKKGRIIGKLIGENSNIAEQFLEQVEKYE
ncbi:MAG: flavodoxin-dependent (E)-4-hydroxy-3-methylbut-2-enyl-diphosphate synthase, partial [Clostridiales bacterium]|nr:flavodoxin-dependent (E)-4-hydroxy-3-methylbut-2-enyl-diphosphate synthase [Clostridiales bacterium]